MAALMQRFVAVMWTSRGKRHVIGDKRATFSEQIVTIKVDAVFTQSKRIGRRWHPGMLSSVISIVSVIICV